MALVTPGPVATVVSGRIGGTVWNAAGGPGPTCRALRIPKNPRSSFQVNSRTHLGFLTTAWRDSLSQAQRDAWDAYAAATDIVNRIGDTVQISGIAHYVRTNGARLAFGLAVDDTAPSTPGLPTPLTIEIALSLNGSGSGGDAGKIVIPSGSIPDIENDAGAYGLFYVSRAAVPASSPSAFSTIPVLAQVAATGAAITAGTTTNAGPVTWAIDGTNNALALRNLDTDNRLSTPTRWTIAVADV